MDTACALQTQNLVPSTMNNWLGFSLSSNQDQDPQKYSFPADLGYECFDLTPNSSIPASIFEAAFSSNLQSQADWSMRDESMKSCNTSPKLENFLEVGGLHDHNMYANSNINIGVGLGVRKQQAPAAACASTLSSLWMSSSSREKLQHCGSDKSSSGANAITRKSMETFGQRTSIYRGVTRHRWTGRYEAHLWDNSSTREGQTRKGRQVYLGGYDKEEKAARSYDLAALKYWGPSTATNFPIGNYEREMEEMKHMTRQEYVASLRRKSSGFSRGASIYRGVTRHHQHGRWQARIGRVAGNKDLYLGTFTTQEEAAEAYDVAAIKFRGLNAVTNFEINRYNVRSIMESTNLPVAKRLPKDQINVDYQYYYSHTMPMPMCCKEEQGFFHEMQLANNQMSFMQQQPSMHNLTAPSTLIHNYDNTTCTGFDGNLYYQSSCSHAPTFTM